MVSCGTCASAALSTWQHAPAPQRHSAAMLCARTAPTAARPLLSERRPNRALRAGSGSVVRCQSSGGENSQNRDAHDASSRERAVRNSLSALDSTLQQRSNQFRSTQGMLPLPTY